MAVAFAIIVLSKQLKKFLRVNARALSFCCRWIHAPSRLICMTLLDQPFHFGRFGGRFSNNTIKKGNLLLGNTIEMKYSSDRVFEAVQTTRCTTCFRACLHEGGGLQVCEVTCGKLPHLTCKRDRIKMRDYLDRRVTPPKQVTSPTWSAPPPCKQAVKDWLYRLTVTISRLLIGRDDMVPRNWRDGEVICFSLFHHPRNFRRNFKRNGRHKLSMLLLFVLPLEF